MSPRADLNQLLADRRVLLCVGCGGVGKTTSCAALGLAAAQQGKHALCLTIDPARRLAQSLGVEKFETEAQRIAPEVFRAAGLEVSGSLTVMMLDTKTTFDALVGSLAKTPEKRDSVLDNVLYKYISTQLAGTAEYMAMEKLHAVKDDPTYDVIILDTPPTSHALDFLDAPERLAGAIDSAAVRWFVKAFQTSGKLSLNLLQKSAATVLRGIGRITGAGFLEQVASFVSEFNELFGGWRKRAEAVSRELRGADVAYVLVTTPDPMSIREVLFFAERLRDQGMVPDAFVVNRMHVPSEDAVEPSEVAQRLSARRMQLASDGAARVVEAARQERRLGELDALHLVALEEAFVDDEGGGNPIVVHVPDFPYDIHDLTRLSWVAEVIAPP